MTHAAHHPDDEAVDRFAAELKAKLADARAKGRDGWRPPASSPAAPTGFRPSPSSGSSGKARSRSMKPSRPDTDGGARWLHTHKDGTLARALRGLQDYYEAVASTHYSHAGALKHGRKAKDAPAATEAAP